jgi:hypothetical protein
MGESLLLLFSSTYGKMKVDSRKGLDEAGLFEPSYGICTLSRQRWQSLAFTEASASPPQPSIPSEFLEGVLLGVFARFNFLST